MQTSTGAIVRGGRELNAGELLDAARCIVAGCVCDQEVLVGYRWIMREGAVGCAGSILIGGRIEVDEFELGIVWNGDDAKGASAATIDKRVSKADGADIQRAERSCSETTVYTVLEEVRVAAAVGTLGTEDLSGIVEASIARAGATDKLDLA